MISVWCLVSLMWMNATTVAYACHLSIRCIPCRCACVTGCSLATGAVMWICNLVTEAAPFKASQCLEILKYTSEFT